MTQQQRDRDEGWKVTEAAGCVCVCREIKRKLLKRKYLLSSVNLSVSGEPTGKKLLHLAPNFPDTEDD